MVTDTKKEKKGEFNVYFATVIISITSTEFLLIFIFIFIFTLSQQTGVCQRSNIINGYVSD